MRTLSRTIVLAMATTLVAGILTTTASPAAANVAMVATGSEFTCAITTKGAVKCWGEGDSGQLGTGSFGGSDTPKQVKGLKKDVWFLAAGEDHACAIQGKGTVKCWGQNTYGQVGDGTEGDPKTTPVKVKKLKGAVMLTAGRYHTCAIAGKKLTLLCWGGNFAGQLGDGTDVTRKTPTKVKKMGKDVVTIAAGVEHTCAIQGKKLALFCWGYNFFGQLGDGSIAQRATPTKVQGMGKSVVAVTAGDYHTCAAQGKKPALSCWGNNQHGQLGDESSGGQEASPTKVKKGKNVVTIGAGGYHTCAVQGKKRTLSCWGVNDAGQVGDGTTDTPKTTPVKTKKMAKDVAMVDGGSYHTCAIKGKGALFCWGYNTSGQLGDGTTDPRYTPKKVKL